MFFVNNKHIHNVKIWRRNAECADLIMSNAIIKLPIVGKCKQNQSYLTPFKWLSVSSDHKIDHNPTYKYQAGLCLCPLSLCI